MATEAALETPSAQRAAVVVGAGRSGTSAITRALQVLGVELGDNLKPGRGKNPTGFFEDQELLALNKRLRRVLGVRADNVAPIDDERWQRPQVQALREQAAATIRRRFGNEPLWGYKYGRTLRLLPFWEAVFDELGLDVRYVVATRNPLSVARSRAKLDARRGRQVHSDLEWLISVVPYFRRLRLRPFLVVDYDRVMAEPVVQLERMADFLDVRREQAVNDAIQDYARAFLRPGMQHSRFSAEDLQTDARVNSITRDAYLALDRLAREELESDPRTFWEEWADIEKRFDDLTPLLHHIDHLESELRQAKWHPAGPGQGATDLWRKLAKR
jgi:hypothetical protein